MTGGFSPGSGSPRMLGGDWPSSGGTVGEEPPTLAADALLTMIDDATGALRAHPRVAGYVVAGALLIELWMGRHVELGETGVTVVAEQRLPADGLLRVALGWLLAEPELVAPAACVEALAVSALDRAAGQVEGLGWIRRVERRRKGVLYEAVDRTQVYWRRARLTVALAQRPTWSDVFLFTLLDAAGLTPELLGDGAYSPSSKQVSTLSASLRETYPVVVELASAVRRLADRVALAPH